MEEKQPTFSEQELDELCEEAIRYRDMGSKEGFDKAIELLTFASELGYADAKLYLAQSYTCNPALIDVEKAEYWYNEWYACEKGIGQEENIRRNALAQCSGDSGHLGTGAGRKHVAPAL